MLRFAENYKSIQELELQMRVQKPKFKNDYEYVDYALSFLERSSSTPLGEIPRKAEVLCKITKESENLRNLGNIAFRSRRFLDAHNFYTLSIASAKAGSKELSLAYGNRSAVLFVKQYYKECLEDIQRALDNNYPSDKKAKLLKRQSKAIELLPTQKKVPFHGAIPTIENRNDTMPSAANCIKINKNQEFGRHIVANRTINPGETLLVEKAYSQWTFPETTMSYYCSECLEVCYNLIPCDNCVGVLYCSITCKQQAYQDYHQYECVLLIHFGIDLINWNATRMTLKGIKEYDNKDTNSTNVYRSDSYKEISELMSCKSSEDSNLQKLVVCSLGAAKVFYGLKNFTDIFAVFDVENKENILKTLLFNASCIDQANSFQVRKYHEGMYYNYGKAIYSVLSLFNHACSENIGLSFYGSTAVLRAKKKINEGEQCFVNYGVDAISTNITDRQISIYNNFNFMCKCQACVQKWPREEVLSLEIIHLLPHLKGIHTHVLLNHSFGEHKKRQLLQKTFTIMERIQEQAPCLTYTYVRNIFNKIMLEGNTHVPF